LSLRFVKVQSLGNDFVLVRAEDVARLDLPDLAIRLCERRFGVGSDGLLVYEVASRNLIRQRMFNPDGTEDFCGNGLRCTARRALDLGEVDETFVFEHLGRTIPARGLPDGRIETTLPPADWSPAGVPTTLDRPWFDLPIEVDGWAGPVSVLSTGSAHLVAFVDRLPDDALFEAVSPLLENHRAFPERVSVMWAENPSPGTLRLRVWERGVGETLACGTGSAATASAYARKTGHVGPVRIVNPGGELVFDLNCWSGPLQAAGTACVVFEGAWWYE
jgi:diaminopimelate epimerase